MIGRFQPCLQEAETNGKDRTARIGEAYPETAGAGKGERPVDSYLEDLDGLKAYLASYGIKM